MPGRNMTIDQLNKQASLRVSTPYVSLSVETGPSAIPTILLPTPVDGKIIGVRITDRDDPLKIYAPATFLGKSNFNPDDTRILALTHDDIQNIHNAGIEHPELHYWVEKSDTPLDTFISPMEIRPDDVNVEGIAATTRLALGVSKNASPEEIQKAIQDKYYSYNPVSENDETLDFSDRSPSDAVLETVETIAGLKSVNCNLAQTAFIAATADKNMEYYNYVSGFRNDGDNILSTWEKHGWTSTSDNTIIDPTPGGGGNIPPLEKFPKKPFKPEISEQRLIGGVAGLVTVGGLLTVWKKRDPIRSRLHKQRIQRVATHPNTAKALAVVNRALYGPEDDPRTIDWSNWVDNTPYYDTAANQRELDMFTRRGISDEEEVAIVQNPTLTPSEKRGIKRVLCTIRKKNFTDMQ